MVFANRDVRVLAQTIDTQTGNVMAAWSLCDPTANCC